ncbi:MAG: UDP-N-acetylmuramoyl-L-alanine--D-glutamate ligase, partial [Cycloclasticus sp.]|nr:UDP-N-acetylmuramoyl-L-alanine--D-glutamate ligase [Cycloclasticus sp.]
MATLINNQQHAQHEGLARLGLDQQGVRVLVVGLGMTGLSVVKFLQQNNISVAVVDSRENPPGLVEVEESYQDVAVFTSSFEHAVFEAATHI